LYGFLLYVLCYFRIVTEFFQYFFVYIPFVIILLFYITVHKLVCFEFIVNKFRQIVCDISQNKYTLGYFYTKRQRKLRYLFTLLFYNHLLFEIYRLLKMLYNL